MNYVAWLWRSIHGVRLNMAFRVAIGTLQVSLGLVMVWLSKRFIDETIRTGSSGDVLRMILWLVLTVVGGILLRQAYYYLTVVASTRQTNMLRLKMFSSLFRRQLYSGDELHSGDVTSRLAKDIEVVCNATTDMLPQMFITGIQLCGAFLLLRYLDERLAWALLLLTPVALVFGKLVARKLRQMTLDIRNDESRIQMHVQEGMEHNAVLRSLGSEQWVTERLDSMQERLKGNVMRRTRFTVVTRLALGCAFGLGYLLAFVWGGLQLRTGAITFGVMTSFLQLVGQIQTPIMQLLNMIPALIHATASIDRLEEVVAQEDSPLVFGKTTLFRLILGFIEPTEGQVEVDGNLCFVPQGNTLMSGTIRYNLQLAKPDATDDELREVLHTACADFVEDLPQGIDTELGERGSGLSEGQAQRIAIARGLLRPGNILLLDEISSALDEPTERELYRRLFAACPDKTMLFITHRLTVTEQCDDVVNFVKNI